MALSAISHTEFIHLSTTGNDAESNNEAKLSDD